MNAYELADCLEELCRESQGSFTKDAYIMLRQQADEIQALKDGFNTAWGGTNNSELAEVRAMANRMVLKVKEQAEKIKNMEIWEKKYLDRIEELEKEIHSINYTCPNCETHVELFYKTSQIKELSDEEIDLKWWISSFEHLKALGGGISDEVETKLKEMKERLKKASEK
jgi:hypothetical protein